MDRLLRLKVRHLRPGFMKLRADPFLYTARALVVIRSHADAPCHPSANISARRFP
jgi:hypothetical protein